jgi:hypothetical protein
VLGVLLIGIVALNVVSLSLSASEGKLAQQAQILEQENSALRARLAERLSSERIRNAAAALGMTAPESTDVNYRDASAEAIRVAARRLGDGFGLGTSLVVDPTTESVADPIATTTTTTSSTPTTTTTATETATTTPVTPTTVSEPTTGTSAGGVSPG